MHACTNPTRTHHAAPVCSWFWRELPYDKRAHRLGQLNGERPNASESTENSKLVPFLLPPLALVYVGYLL